MKILQEKTEKVALFICEKQKKFGYNSLPQNTEKPSKVKTISKIVAEEKTLHVDKTKMQAGTSDVGLHEKIIFTLGRWETQRICPSPWMMYL